MKLLSLTALISSLVTSACIAADYKITFGSCADQEREQIIWNAIGKEQSDVFLFMGDNVYHDSADKAVITAVYNKLGSNPNYQSFIKTTPVLATWDDHDYGEPDGGNHFSGKHIAKSIFLDFYNVPASSPAYEKDRGIHAVKYLGKNKDVQIIMLDTRWYRDEIEWSKVDKKILRKQKLGHFTATKDTTKSILGDAQWQWLESQLQQPAKVRIIASSIQLIPEFTGWEAWANFPHERKKMLDLLNKYNDNNMVIVSGDVHRGEFSQYQLPSKQTVWEISSSGLDAKVYPAAPNMHRVGDATIALNYGVLEIDINDKGVSVSASLKSDQGKVLTQHKVL